MTAGRRSRLRARFAFLVIMHWWTNNVNCLAKIFLILNRDNQKGFESNQRSNINSFSIYTEFLRDANVLIHVGIVRLLIKFNAYQWKKHKALSNHFYVDILHYDDDFKTTAEIKMFWNWAIKWISLIAEYDSVRTRKFYV